MNAMLLVLIQGGGAGEGGSQTSSRISFCSLQSALLLLPFQKDINSSLLSNYVLGAQLSHGYVSNLSEPVNISFWHNQSLVLLGDTPISSPSLPSCSYPVECWFEQTQPCGTILETNCFKF